MRERIVAFDYLRALAITGILLCHFCHNYNSISFLGHYFGGVFVTLFIAMSGMLFGIVWNNTKWYAGASTVIHTYNYKKEQFSTNSSFGSLNIYVGVNFGRKRHH